MRKRKELTEKREVVLSQSQTHNFSISTPNVDIKKPITEKQSYATLAASRPL